jgi:hypothetical protein
MADDIARLGIQVVTSGADTSAKQLDVLTASSGRAEKATDSLRFSSKEFAAALSANGNNIEKATAALAQNATATGAVAAAQKAATAQAAAAAASAGATMARTLGAVGSSAVRAAGEFVPASESMAASLGMLGSASVRTAAQVALSEEAMAASAVAGAAVHKAANDHIAGSSTALRESLTLLREASVGNYTRMAGSASILLQALGLLYKVIVPLGIAAAAFGAAFLVATNQINSGVKGTGDLTRGLGLTAEQLDRVQNRYVTLGDTAKATFQVLVSYVSSPNLARAWQETWNFIAQVTMDTLAGIVGSVIGTVRVIGEAWKAMPQALGGEGTTANIDFGRAFKSGIDDAKKSLDRFYADVAAQARKNAISRILEEAGKPAKTSDHGIDQAQRQLAEAQNQLSAQKALNDAVLSGSLAYADMVKQEQIDSELKSIIARRDADLAKGTAESRKEAEALTRVIAQLRPVYSALYDQKLVSQQIAANDNLKQQNGLLEKQIEVAGKLSDQREMEIAQYKEIQHLRSLGIDPNSSIGQTSLSTVADNVRRQQGVRRADILNQLPDSGTRLGTQAATNVLTDPNSPTAQIERQRAAYAEIDKLRQQDVLNDQQASRAKAQVDAQLLSDRMANAQSFFGNLATLSSSSNKTIAGIGKAAAIAQATIDGILAVQKALASAPPPYNFALAAAVGVATAANVAAIEAQGYATGVVGVQRRGGASSDTILAMLSPGESIVNPAGTQGNENTLAAMNRGAKFDGGANSNGRPTILIQQMPGVVVEEAPGLTEDQVVLIVRREAPKAAANDLRRANSPMAKATRDSIQAKRKRS